MVRLTKISKRVSQLNKNEPWTRKELSTFDRRERNFIRGIQIKESCNKKLGIKRYNMYLKGNIKNKKLFRKEVRKSLLLDYVKKERKVKGEREIKKVKEKRKIKPEKVPKIKPLKIKSISFLSSKGLNNYFKTNKISPVTRSRMRNAFIKYPHDTRYQLQHGHNARPVKRGKRIKK